MSVRRRLVIGNRPILSSDGFEKWLWTKGSISLFCHRSIDDAALEIDGYFCNVYLQLELETLCIITWIIAIFESTSEGAKARRTKQKDASNFLSKYCLDPNLE